MSNRILRVNELLQREMSAILRKHYQVEAVTITITSIEVTPDLLEGKVFVAIMGDEAAVTAKLRWLKKHSQEIRFELGRRVVLKHMPKFTYEIDTTTARGNRILGILDEIDTKEGTLQQKQTRASQQEEKPRE